MTKSLILWCVVRLDEWTNPSEKWYASKNTSSSFNKVYCAVHLPTAISIWFCLMSVHSLSYHKCRFMDLNQIELVCEFIEVIYSQRGKSCIIKRNWLWQLWHSRKKASWYKIFLRVEKGKKMGSLRLWSTLRKNYFTNHIYCKSTDMIL